ncbi:putative RNA-binding protein [Trypanosoma grayi]|uniref:putative RNA-binding protein n=1 Tax=Trypanosoma grayi TaxID=71804 RepID=UPI0004F441AB|nr:putative RNA-binding protein [Trypanosoma grayi]KEG11134.1 putative RNA-binding protein [Trypanosoma grayi]
MPPPHRSGGRHPLVTAAILIETSLGSFIVDLYGADCPAATAEVVNLCRCKYFNGCIATEVIPDNVIIFSHPVESLRCRTFPSLVGDAAVGAKSVERPTTGTALERLMRQEWERMKGHTATLQVRQGSATVQFVPQHPLEAAGAIRHQGLLLLEVPQLSHASDTGSVAKASRLVLTLSQRHLDYFEGDFMVLGEVREGIRVIEKMRAAPHQRSVSSATTAAARPTRLIRIKHATVLPTAGTEAFSDVVRSSSSTSAQESGALGLAVKAAGCFRHWASSETVKRANSALVALLRSASAASNAGDHTGVPPGTAFFMLYGRPLQGISGETDTLKNDKGNSNKNNNSNDDRDDLVSVEYNPHYHGDYLSSDEEAPHAESRKERESRHQAVMRMHQDKLNATRTLMLNLLDGVADASGEMKPPENVLFVCKLNPLTTGEGLSMCFSQFGAVRSAEVVQDRKTGNSLCYGFVEFADVEACYRAFQKMDNALVDDQRIHVDFSQSVSRLWAQRQRELRKRARDEEEKEGAVRPLAARGEPPSSVK